MNNNLVHSKPITTPYPSEIVLAEHPFRINGTISIDPELQQARMTYLLDSIKCTVVVSLDSRKLQIINTLLNNSISHLQYPLADTINKLTETISLEKIKEIWNLCKKFLESKHKILIHCGSGNGRTSVVVASLLLIMEYKSNPTQFKIKNKPKDNIHVITSSYDEKTRECPISIKEIINKLRHDFNPKAIETLGNVDTLIELCRHLLTEKNIFDQ